MQTSPLPLKSFYVRTRLCAFVMCTFLLTFGLLSGVAAARTDLDGTSPPESGNSLKILRITPSGEDVPAGRQIVFQFNRPVVPLGRMEREPSEVPVSIEPAINCRWRWLNASTLACQLDEKHALLPATRYRITVQPEIVTAGGAVLSEEISHTFLTVRPAVPAGSTWIREWLSPGTPQIVVRFNQQVDEASAAEHLFFQTRGGLRVPVLLMGDAQFKKSDSYEENVLWLVTPKDELPLDEAVELRVEPGVLSVRGSEPGVQEEVLSRFHTFPVFRFTGVQCRTLDDTEVVFYPDEPLSGQPACNPVRGISLLFSAPLTREEARRGIRLNPELAGAGEKYDPWSGVYADSHTAGSHSQGQQYSAFLPPEVLRPFSQYGLQVEAGGMEDRFGRPLAESAQMQFATDHLPPSFELRNNTPVLEKGLDTEVFLSATNLDHVVLEYETLSISGKTPRAGKILDIPQTPDTTYAIPLGIRQMLPDTSGLARGQLTPHPPVQYWHPSEGWFFAQVTPFHVHVKMGHYNTLVWVTDLRSGEAVPDVEVVIHKEKDRSLVESPEPLARAVTGEDGLALLPGSSELDPRLRLLQADMYDDGQEEAGAGGDRGEGAPEQAAEEDGMHLSVRCRKGDDMAVVPLLYQFAVSAEGANREHIPDFQRPRYGHLRAWGATAQGIYKVGDTVQYKVYVRNQDNYGFIPPPGAVVGALEDRPQSAASPSPPAPGNGRKADDITPQSAAEVPTPSTETPAGAQPPGDGGSPPETRAPNNATGPRNIYTLRVMDPMDKVVHERRDIRMSRFGACDGEFTIPQNGAVGWYRFVLSADFTKEKWEPMRILVSDFTPSPFKVEANLNGKVFRIGQTVQVDTQARLHAGGPYTKAAVRVTAALERRPFASEDPRLAQFHFGAFETGKQEPADFYALHEAEGVLDDEGSMQSRFTITENPVVFGRLTVESAVRDDRGKFVANRTTADYLGRDRYVGMAQGDWVLQKDVPADVQVVVVDRHGKPAPGTATVVTVERRETRASRVKGAGDTYLTQYVHEWVAVENAKFVSGHEPHTFRFTPSQPGSYRIKASISDTAGRPHATAVERWVSGSGRVLWETVPGNLMNIYPEKKEYRVGETARFFVQNPFPGARAILTVERYGVMRSWVKTFEKSTEMVEIPVLPEYLPGFYFSVVVTSPRVEKAAEDTGAKPGADLGKPAFRMGYVEVPVLDPYKEIEVRVKSDRDVYRPREVVTVELQAASRNLKPGEPQEPMELAVAVLDESVFDLLHQGRNAFDPYRGFYRLDPLDLKNYNLLMHLVGREKLEKKGANPGGDGGPDLSMRSLFKFVSFWNPSLPVDAEGRARIEFQVPDNLTGWRVLAMAVTPRDRMGLGDAAFQVNQPIEIRPVMPNQVTEGDTFEAAFSLMNRSESPKTIEVAIRAEGPIEKGKDGNSRSVTRQITAEPYKRYTVRLPLKAVESGKITLKARAGDGADRDAVEYTLPVSKRQSLETAAVYGTTTDDEVVEPLVFPEDMRADAGRIAVSVSPSAIGSIEGAFRYMRTYPYTCWEQMLTKAVMAACYRALEPYIGKAFSWEESKDIPAKTLAVAAEHQAPNGGMAYYVPRDEYADPFLSAYTALAFGWLKAYGYTVPQPVEEKLHEYLQAMLRRDAAADTYSRGMTATVWAAALAALADGGKIGRSDVERYWNHVPDMSLFGKALYLEALLHFPETWYMQQQLLQTLLTYADQTSGTITFQEELDSGYQRILTSSLRTNSAILSAMLKFHEAAPANPTLGDIPLRLMHTVTRSRQGRSHWRSTQDNIFAARALVDFSRVYEGTKPDMAVRALLDDELLGEGRFTDVGDPQAAFERPVKPQDPGRKADVRLQRTGEGRLYYTASILYAPARLRTDSVNAGIEIQKEYSVERNGGWVLLTDPMDIRTGELVRVDIYVSLPAERYFVVVNDPVPGGLEPVNRDLATASTVDADKAALELPAGSMWYRFDDWKEFGHSHWSFYHRELRFDSTRFYSEYLPAGRYHLSYVAQAVAPGEFTVLPAHAEEMYNPDVFGKGSPAMLRVGAAME